MTVLSCLHHQLKVFHLYIHGCNAFRRSLVVFCFCFFCLFFCLFLSAFTLQWRNRLARGTYMAVTCRAMPRLWVRASPGAQTLTHTFHSWAANTSLYFDLSLDFYRPQNRTSSFHSNLMSKYFAILQLNECFDKQNKQNVHHCLYVRLATRWQCCHVCIINEKYFFNTVTYAPVAQSVSARYLYGSNLQGDAEVVSSNLTWSTISEGFYGVNILNVA